MSKQEPTLVSVSVDTASKLLKKLTAKHQIGSKYEYLYQDKVVASVDSTVVGVLEIIIAPSAWAQAVSEGLWQYELDESVTVDPTTVDPSLDGWYTMLFTGETADKDIEVLTDDESPIDELAEILADSEEETE
jgi:hypothetical protein